MDSPNREDFLKNLQKGGKYEGTVAIYRESSSVPRVGMFDRALIRAFPPGVRWIAHDGAGYDQIDVNACKEKGTSRQSSPSVFRDYLRIARTETSPHLGIILSNTPVAVDDATATTALYLMISAFRHFSSGEQSLRAGRWNSDVSTCLTHDLTGKTLAILGLGGIGSRLAELARAFPMRVIYHSRRKVEGAPDWCEYFGREQLDEFLGLADVLSVHVPLRPDTEGLISEKMIRKLKRGAILVNTARGKVIDEAALIRALEDGHVSLQLVILGDIAAQGIVQVGCCRSGRLPERTCRQSAAS